MAMLDNSLTTTVTALAVTFWLKHPRVLDNSPCFFRFFGTPGSQKAMDPSPISKVITALLKEGWAVFNSLKCHGNLDHWGDQYLLIPVWWFGTWLLFFHVLGIVTPTDFHIFQRGRSTTNQNRLKTSRARRRNMAKLCWKVCPQNSFSRRRGKMLFSGSVDTTVIALVLIWVWINTY